MNNVIATLKGIFNFNKVYFVNILYSIIFFIIIKLILYIINFLNKKYSHNEKKIYFYNRRNKTIFTILYMIIIFIIWRAKLKDIITLISFISAAITLAARDIIYNYFCGIYIKVIKTIKIEDRIKVGDTIGDIININALSFELLEVNIETN